MSRVTRVLVLSLLLGVVLYGGLAAAYGDFSQVAGHIGRFPLEFLLLALALASLNYLFRFAKWQYYLAVLGVSIPVWSSLGIFLAGFSLTVTPGKVGEVVKSYLLKQSFGVPIVRTSPIVLAERLTDLIALLLLTLLGVTTWVGPGERWVLLVGGVLCAGLWLVLAWPRLAHLCISLVARLPPRRITDKVAPKLREFYDGTAVLVRPRALAVCTVLSLFAWFSECVGFYVILRGFPGVRASLLLASFIYSMMTVAGALAFVPGGVGVTEGGMALLLTKLAQGMDQSTAVAATLMIRVATLWFAVLLGVISLAVVQRIHRVKVEL